jgi:hypothetical protein
MFAHAVVTQLEQHFPGSQIWQCPASYFSSAGNYRQCSLIPGHPIALLAANVAEAPARLAAVAFRLVTLLRL